MNASTHLDSQTHTAIRYQSALIPNQEVFAPPSSQYFYAVMVPYVAWGQYYYSYTDKQCSTF